jgi:hypothetical protein
MDPTAKATEEFGGTVMVMAELLVHMSVLLRCASARVVLADIVVSGIRPG